MTKKANAKKRAVEKELAKKELIYSINNVILELENAYDNYEVATGKLIDFYACDIKAKQAKYNYLREQLNNLNYEF